MESAGTRPWQGVGNAVEDGRSELHADLAYVTLCRQFAPTGPASATGAIGAGNIDVSHTESEGLVTAKPQLESATAMVNHNLRQRVTWMSGGRA